MLPFIKIVSPVDQIISLLHLDSRILTDFNSFIYVFHNSNEVEEEETSLHIILLSNIEGSYCTLGYSCS